MKRKLSLSLREMTVYPILLIGVLTAKAKETIQHSKINSPNQLPSLIEKITNAIDSLLLKECQLKDIQPDSKNAPKNLEEALELFFNIPKGNLEHLSSQERGEIAKNIQVITTGKKESPDILIFDNGEGQYPEDFHKTFLSIGTSNKNDIHFCSG